MLYDQYTDLGYAQYDTFHYVDGKTGEDASRISLKWTQKGRMFLYEFLKERGILPVMEREGSPHLLLPVGAVLTSSSGGQVVIQQEANYHEHHKN